MDTIETKIYTAFIIASVVIGALFLYFAVKMIRNHRRHFDLLRTYYLNEVELLENDRARTARDLHDELGPLVSVANLLIQNCRGADEEDREFLAKPEESMNELTIRMGGIVKNLTPTILNDKGLRSAIEQFIDTCRTVSNIRFLFSCDLKQEPVQQLALHLYRMVQELLHNALKHSNATIVELQIVEENESIHLFYRDDGIGLTEDSFNEGSGIRNMRNRVTVLNGLMQVNQQNKKGTEIYFSLPINQPYA